MISDEALSALVQEHFDLRPKGIVQMLDLLRPIYEKTAAYGHFGRDEPEFSWEKTDKAAALRAGAGLARTGSVFGHGSGDIALAFSTAYTVPQQADHAMPALALLHDGLIDGLFQAVADSTEQAILHALWRATSVTGRNGHQRHALADLLPAGPAA